VKPGVTTHFLTAKAKAVFLSVAATAAKSKGTAFSSMK